MVKIELTKMELFQIENALTLRYEASNKVHGNRALSLIAKIKKFRMNKTPDFTYKPKIVHKCYKCVKYNKKKMKCGYYGVELNPNHNCCRHFYLGEDI